MRTTARMAAGGSGVAAALLLTLVAAPPAGAHITPDKEEVPAGGYTQVTLTVPHGCEESPTRQLAVEIPEGLVSVTPMVHPGWDIDTTEVTLDEPVDLHGEEVTESVGQVTFTAQDGNELPPEFRDAFTIGFRTPETPGEWLFFKTVQTCVEGETAWIEEYTGEGEEPEHPAPALRIGPAEEEGAEDAAAADTGSGDGAPADGESAAADTTDDGDSSTGIAVAGLVVGLLGLAAGGLALLQARRLTAAAGSGSGSGGSSATSSSED
jgi:periplasmic copper chaperone A